MPRLTIYFLPQATHFRPRFAGVSRILPQCGHETGSADGYSIVNAKSISNTPLLSIHGLRALGSSPPLLISRKTLSALSISAASEGEAAIIDSSDKGLILWLLLNIPNIPIPKSYAKSQYAPTHFTAQKQYLCYNIDRFQLRKKMVMFMAFFLALLFLVELA